MSLQTATLGAVAFLIGVLLSVQAPINTLVGARLGHPLAGAVFSFVAGTVFLVAVMLLTVRTEIAWAEIRSFPPWLWLGGVLGAIYITSAIVLTPRIGVGALIALAIAGQVTASLALDHYGLMGLDIREITPGRIGGAALVVLGALMVWIF